MREAESQIKKNIREGNIFIMGGETIMLDWREIRA